VNELVALQNEFGSNDDFLSYPSDVFRVQSNRFHLAESIFIQFLIPHINGDLRFAVSEKIPHGHEVSERPFCQYCEGDFKIMIPREAKRPQVLISLWISEHPLAWFRSNAMIERFDFMIEAFDELSCEFPGSLELIVIAPPGSELKIRFHVWMRQRRWLRLVSYVLPVSCDIAAKMLQFDFCEQKEFKFGLQTRTKINPKTLSPSVIQVQSGGVRKVFDINLDAPMNVHLRSHGACKVPHVCLDHTQDEWLQIYGEPRSLVQEFVEKSYPVVFIAR
jgi:hypothetical protein